MDVKPISADRVRLLDDEEDRPVREELLEMARQIYRNLELESANGVLETRVGMPPPKPNRMFWTSRMSR